MSAGGGLLAVHAHPDDETISTGALLATWSASGRPVTVVTCTRGERGEVIPPELAHLEADPAALAVHRETELARALLALAVHDHVFLDQVPAPTVAQTGVERADGVAASGARYEDSGMAWVSEGTAGPAAQLPEGGFVAAPVAEAAGRLAAVIADRRPDVVVGYEPGGGYGHPDHVHAHRVMERAVRLAAEAAPGRRQFRVPVMLWTAQDERELAAGCREVSPLAKPPLRAVDLSAPAPPVAVSGSIIDVRVDVAPVVQRLGTALRAHASQIQAVDTWPERAGGATLGCFALSVGVLLPVLRTEGYRFADGWPPRAVMWPVGVRVG